MASNGNGAGAVLAEAEFAKTVTFAVFVFGSMLVVLLANVWNKGSAGFGDSIAAARTHAMCLALVIVGSYVAIQLIGDLAVAGQFGSLDDVNENDLRQTRIIIYGTAGVALAILLLVMFWGVVAKSAKTVSSRAYGLISGFGKKRRRRN